MIYFGYPLDIHGWKPKPETEPESKPEPEPENRGRKTNTKPEKPKPADTRTKPDPLPSLMLLLFFKKFKGKERKKCSWLILSHHHQPFSLGSSLPYHCNRNRPTDWHVCGSACSCNNTSQKAHSPLTTDNKFVSTWTNTLPRNPQKLACPFFFPFFFTDIMFVSYTHHFSTS